MTREELLALRDRLQARVAERKQVGDFDANAPAVRESLQANLQIVQHLIDRMKKP